MNDMAGYRALGTVGNWGAEVRLKGQLLVCSSCLQWCGNSGPELPEFPMFQEKPESQIFMLHLSILKHCL